MRLVLGAAATLGVCVAVGTFGLSRAPSEPGPTRMGPLRVLAANPRYFTDGSGRAVYLTGSHVWWNRADRTWRHSSCQGAARRFDYAAHLDRLQRLRHNFIRLWTWELTRWDACGDTVSFAPQPWARTGPGTALDGRPRFDLTRWDESYFRRLRARVQAARAHGIYVAVMLFEGWALQFQDKPWDWNAHPFNRANNVNGIDGDSNADGRGLELHTLAQPAVTAIQTAYVRRVVEVLGDLDNVLYEVVNESHPQSFDWQAHMVDVIKRQEASGGLAHPVGVTYFYEDTGLWPATADWISPGGLRYVSDPPPSDGDRVILSDSDHHCGICAHELFPWKALLRGNNPIFMDPFFERPDYEAVRRALGRTRRLADRVDLRRATPRPELASTRYALASPGREFVVLQPRAGRFTVDLRGAPGRFRVRWIEVRRPRERQLGTVAGGTVRSFAAPFGGPSVLWLRLVSRP